MPRASLTANRLIETAAELVDETGFERTTLTLLAGHFDVKVASLYAHLSGAHALKTGIALHALALLAEQVSDAIAGRSGREALAALANTHRDFALRHPGLFEATRYRLDPADAAASAGPRLAELMRAALRGYGLGKVDETHAVRLIGSVVLGFTLLEQGGSFAHSPPDPAASWERSIDALDRLLRSWPAIIERPQ